MTSGKGLGKGLSALFGEELIEETTAPKSTIPLRDIEPNPEQPRREFDPAALEELAESIRQNGIITPITVRKDGIGYQIIAGERRWRAARMAGLNEVPAYVLDVDAREAYQLALVENLQRQDLNPIEEAMGYQKLIEELGLSQERAGEKIGRSRAYIANALRLLNLPQAIMEMVASGALSAGHGRALVVLPEEKALEAAKIILEQELSVRETEKLVKKMQMEKRQTQEKIESQWKLYVQELEKTMSADTGHKISIVHGRKKGKLTIEYYGNDDLERVCAALQQIEKNIEE